MIVLFLLLIHIYDRLGPRCGNVKDVELSNIEATANLKHSESLRTITDDSNYGSTPYAEVLHSDNRLESREDLEGEIDPEPHEFENLRSRGCAKITTITISSVTGRTTIRETEG